MTPHQRRHHFSILLLRYCEESHKHLSRFSPFSDDHRRTIRLLDPKEWERSDNSVGGGGGNGSWIPPELIEDTKQRRLHLCLRLLKFSTFRMMTTASTSTASSQKLPTLQTRKVMVRMALFVLGEKIKMVDQLLKSAEMAMMMHRPSRNTSSYYANDDSGMLMTRDGGSTDSFLLSSREETSSFLLLDSSANAAASTTTLLRCFSTSYEEQAQLDDLSNRDLGDGKGEAAASIMRAVFLLRDLGLLLMDLHNRTVRSDRSLSLPWWGSSAAAIKRVSRYRVNAVHFSEKIFVSAAHSMLRRRADLDYDRRQRAAAAKLGEGATATSSNAAFGNGEERSSSCSSPHQRYYQRGGEEGESDDGLPSVPLFEILEQGIERTKARVLQLLSPEQQQGTGSGKNNRKKKNVNDDLLEETEGASIASLNQLLADLEKHQREHCEEVEEFDE